MAFEYPTPAGLVLLMRTRGVWKVRFAGEVRGRWGSPDAAAVAVAQHKSGLPALDRKRLPISEDLIDWRPGRFDLEDRRTDGLLPWMSQATLESRFRRDQKAMSSEVLRSNYPQAPPKSGLAPGGPIHRMGDISVHKSVEGLREGRSQAHRSFDFRFGERRQWGPLAASLWWRL